MPSISMTRASRPVLDNTGTEVGGHFGSRGIPASLIADIPKPSVKSIVHTTRLIVFDLFCFERINTPSQLNLGSDFSNLRSKLEVFFGNQMLVKKQATVYFFIST